MHILLAEDDAETASIIERQLGETGHVVTRVADGEEALQRGMEDTFDVLVLDRMLPTLDGVEILKRWREAGVATPVLMLTALGGIADRVTGLDAGADDYLVKPFAFAELAARLSALSRRRPISEVVTRFEAGSITLDLLKREVRRAGNPQLHHVPGHDPFMRTAPSKPEAAMWWCKSSHGWKSKLPSPIGGRIAPPAGRVHCCEAERESDSLRSPQASGQRRWRKRKRTNPQLFVHRKHTGNYRHFSPYIPATYWNPPQWSGR